MFLAIPGIIPADKKADKSYANLINKLRNHSKIKEGQGPVTAMRN